MGKNFGKTNVIFYCILTSRKQSHPNNGLNPICHTYTTEFNGQTPLSQIISSGPSHTSDSSSMLFDSFSTRKRKQSTLISSPSVSSKRGVLPKSATSIMRSWLFQHIVKDFFELNLLFCYYFHRFILIQLKMKNELYHRKQIYLYFK